MESNDDFELSTGMYVRAVKDGVTYFTTVCYVNGNEALFIFTRTADGKQAPDDLYGDVEYYEMTPEERHQYFDMLTGEPTELPTTTPILSRGEVVITEDGIAAVLATDLIAKDDGVQTSILHFDMNRLQKDSQDTPCGHYRRATKEEREKFWALVSIWVMQSLEK